MFKTKIINDKHFIKNNNLLIKSTFYTTPVGDGLKTPNRESSKVEKM